MEKLQESDDEKINQLMQRAIRLHADHYYMFWEFMKRKNRSSDALIWMDRFISHKLTRADSTNTPYTDMIIVDYLRSILKLDAKNINEEQQQISHHCNLYQIMKYEAENNSVLNRLNAEELSNLKRFCKELADPTEYKVSVFLDEYGKDGDGIIELFKRHYPAIPYPSSYDELQELIISPGFCVVVYKKLLSDNVPPNAEMWYKELHESGIYNRILFRSHK
jgi:hypothetical protein